jgi:hypothetical protein
MQARPFETPKDSLKKGEFTWAPELSPTGPMLVIVGLSDQKAYTYRNGILIGVATISTGKKGHETPTGVFHTIYKDANHHSSKYNNAPMPYTQRFTSGGVALHAGGLPGYPSSHGCVHLPSVYAQLLFREAPLGMTVVVTNVSRFPESVNHPLFLSPVSKEGQVLVQDKLTENESYRWKPEASGAGPVSLVISGEDKRLIVLRNGVEIGRSRVTIKNDRDSLGTWVYVAHSVTPVTAPGQIGLKWIAHELTDVNYKAYSNGNSGGSFSRIKIPDDFLALLQPLLVEGTTMVITDASINRKTSGRAVSVMSSHPGS